MLESQVCDGKQAMRFLRCSSSPQAQDDFDTEEPVLLALKSLIVSNKRPNATVVDGALGVGWGSR